MFFALLCYTAAIMRSERLFEIVFILLNTNDSTGACKKVCSIGAYYLPAILFFYSFNYLNSSLPVYTFKTICSEDKKIILPDGVTKAIINSASADKEGYPELKAFSSVSLP